MFQNCSHSARHYRNIRILSNHLFIPIILNIRTHKVWALKAKLLYIVFLAGCIKIPTVEQMLRKFCLIQSLLTAFQKRSNKMWLFSITSTTKGKKLNFKADEKDPIAEINSKAILKTCVWRYSVHHLDRKYYFSIENSEKIFPNTS